MSVKSGRYTCPIKQGVNPGRFATPRSKKRNTQCSILVAVVKTCEGGLILVVAQRPPKLYDGSCDSFPFRYHVGHVNSNQPIVRIGESRTCTESCC